MIKEGSRLDIASAEYANDPYGHYRRLRAEADAHWIESGGPDKWILVTRYDIGRAVLADNRFSKHLPDRYVANSTSGGEGRSMLGSDPPAHTRLRAAVAATFSAQGVARRRPTIERISRELIEKIVSRLDSPDVTSAELRHEYALPFAFSVLADIIGIPTDRLAEFHRWTTTMLSPATSAAERTAQSDAVANIRTYVYERVRLEAEHRGSENDAGHDPLLRTLAVDSSPDALTDTEIVTMITLLLAAGYEGVANMILNGLAALLTHPDQWELLTKSPDLIEPAVREILRYDCPVQRATLRVATEDVVIGNITFPKGSLVGVSLASANHDERHFDNAEAFDITRPTSANMAFGHGIHRCLGSSLALLEGTVAFSHLTSYLPDMRLAPGTDAIQWRRTGLLRGPEEIRIIRGGRS